MAEARPAIPAEIRRQVLVEAGHRCAIPTCRQIPVEIDHIEEWADVHEHRFENLIVLCANCHARKTKGEIDRKAMRQYKANLGLLTSRYSELERRVLEVLGSAPEGHVVELASGSDILLLNLLRDQLIDRTTTPEWMKDPNWLVCRPPQHHADGTWLATTGEYALTPAGRELALRHLSAQPID